MFFYAFSILFAKMASVTELIEVLRARGEAAARELAAQLRLSQPQISRLIKAAGDRVCRIGKGRATRYALYRTIPNLGSRLPVREIDELGSVRAHGKLHLLASDRCWLEREDGSGQTYEGLPPFALDMCPQGYMGREFPAGHPDLDLPTRITDWNDDHRLIAIARRGEDCVGNLIVGDESFSQFLSFRLPTVQRAEYPDLARRSLSEQPGSSAGGEQPKFTVFNGDRHLLVKFASGDPSPVTRRWQELLTCEREALCVVSEAGIDSARAVTCDVDDGRFLEVDRFDRVGERGRRAVLSLYSIACQHLGYLHDWIRAADDLLANHFIDSNDARNIRWLDTFGQLIGNTDRHFGNLTFYESSATSYKLAPVYDMLPMAYAPQGTSLVDRPFVPLPPRAGNFEVWSQAAGHAVNYWHRLASLQELSVEFRAQCEANSVAVDALARQQPSP